MRINYTAIILAAFLLLAATGREILLLQPISPTSSVIIEECFKCFPTNEDLAVQAQPYLQKGYIVKSISIGENRVYMVLEKY